MTQTRLPPVPLFTLFTRMGGWYVIVMGGVLLIFTAISQTTLNTAQRFEQEGLAARATVTERYTTESRDSDGDTTTTYWLILDYIAQGGREIRNTRSVGSSFYRNVTEGDEIDILYLRSSPGQIEVDPGSHASGARITQAIALVMGVIWLAGLWIVGRWTVEAVRARRYGACEDAQVTGTHRTKWRINNRPRYRLHWRDAAGRTGQSLLHKGEVSEDFQIGDPVRIYQGVKRSWWVGDVGDREG